MFTFDGDNKLIIADPGLTEFSATEVYSDWKEWAIQGDNAKYLKAFEVVGGNPISATNNAPSFFFTINDWKIRPQEADHTLTVTGNLSNEGGVGSPFIPTLGSYNVQIQANTSASPAVVTGGSSTGQESIYLSLGDINIPI